MEMWQNIRIGKVEDEELNEGVFLTWNDLCVSVSISRIGSKNIIEGVTGYARPSELLAVMGPSGSGKSTLLDALAGIYIYVLRSQI